MLPMTINMECIVYYVRTTKMGGPADFCSRRFGQWHYPPWTIFEPTVYWSQCTSHLLLSPPPQKIKISTRKVFQWPRLFLHCYLVLEFSVVLLGGLLFFFLLLFGLTSKRCSADFVSCFVFLACIATRRKQQQH